MGPKLGKCCEGPQNELITEKFPNTKMIQSNNELDDSVNNINPDETSRHKKTPLIKKYPIHNFNEKILSTVSKSGDSTISNLDSISYDKKKIIKLQSFIRTFLFHNKFVSSLKQQLIDNQNQLYNDLYEQNMKYNTKLAESLIGYKFNIRSETKDSNKKEKGNIIFHNVLINYPNNVISSFYYGDVNIDNKKHGYGIQIMSDGSKYEGNWLQDKFTGFGRYINQNGDLFEGNFIEGKLNNNGLKRGVDGNVYIGEFKNGLKHGNGCEENDEIEYKGQFENDYRQGKGKIIFKKIKETYEGEFTKGVINGVGVYSFKSGDIYQGEFVHGKMHGKGLYKWKSGEEYYGDYVNGIKEGKGVFKYINGKVFDGQFKKGKPWGCGKIRLENNKKEYDVIFKNGKLIESKKI